MGRHSSGSEWHFYRSVIAWFLPWVVVAGVIAVGLTVGVQQLGGGDEPIVAVEPSPSRSNASPSPSPSPKPSKTPKATPSPSPKISPSPDVELITEDIQVQILNGTAAADGGERMQERLEGLGFTVVAVDEAALQYEETTIFWSFPASRKAAEALASRFDWKAEAKPANLSATVDIHVVVGADES